MELNLSEEQDRAEGKRRQSRLQRPPKGSRTALGQYCTSCCLFKDHRMKGKNKQEFATVLSNTAPPTNYGRKHKSGAQTRP